MFATSTPAGTRQSAWQSARRRALIVPREHGAWGILLIPLFTGAGVALASTRQLVPLVLLTILAVAVFWMRTPLQSRFGGTPVRAQTPQERQLAERATIILAAIAVIACAGLFWHGSNPALFFFAAIAALAFAAQMVLKRRGRVARTAAELFGSFGLASTAPAAYYVMTGKLDERAWALWLANWLFAGDQIHYVALRIRGARAAGWQEKFALGWPFLGGEFLLIVVLVAAGYFRLLPPWVPLAYAPILFRGTTWFWQKPRTLVIQQLGFAELAHAVAFGLLLITAFRLG